MSEKASPLSPVLSELDEIVDHLDDVRARAASAFAAEMYFFAEVADLVQRRERERAAHADDGSKVDATQLAMREIFADVAAALRLSEYQVAARVSTASVLMHDFKETLDRVSDGELSPAHAQIIADIGVEISDDRIRGAYELLALDMAMELTAAQLKTALMGVVSRLDPEGTQQRIREAVSERKLTLRELKPGLSRVVLDAPTAQAAGIYNRAREIALEVEAENKAEANRVEADGVDANGAGANGTGAGVDPSQERASEENGDSTNPEFVADTRTLAQIMADVACDLLLTGAPEGHGTTDEGRSALAAIRPTVEITIPATTLVGVTVGGGELIGHGPIDDETARQIAGLADEWIRVFTDPATGVPVTVDRRRPCTAQSRLLRARDEHCRFPGCRRPVAKCDVDHTIAHAEGGPTALWNLEHLCERHHTVKHHTDWRVEQLPGGVLRWISPTRRIHTTRPPGAIRFVDLREREPAPF